MDDAEYPDGFVGNDDGPRTTPAFDSGSVFVLTSYLKLYRLNASNGAVIWQKDLVALYGGTVIRYQNAASPLIDGGLIYLNASCASSSLMALRTSDGSVAWRSQNEALTHSTPVLATLQGVRQVIFATGSGLVSLDPLTGGRLWRCNYPFTYNPLYSTAVTPVVHQDMVFMSGVSSDGYGSFVRRVTFTNNAWTSALVWHLRDPSSAFTTPVARDGFLYGPFGGEATLPLNQLKCVDMRTGTVKWSQAGFGKGGLLMVGDYLMVQTERCELVLVQANPTCLRRSGAFHGAPALQLQQQQVLDRAGNRRGQGVLAQHVLRRCLRFLPAGFFARDAGPSVAVPRQPVCADHPDGQRDPDRFQPARRHGTASLDQSRAAGVRLAQSDEPLLLTNGVARVLNVDGRPPQQYFIVREPQ